MIKLQASSANRFINCPASLHIENKGLYQNLYGEAAEWGTSLHAAGEKAILTFLNGEKPNFKQILSEVKIDRKHPRYEEALFTVKMYYDVFTREQKRLLKDGFFVEYLIEQKIRMNVEGAECVAKMDCALIAYKKGCLYINVYDLKTGHYDYTNSAADQLYFTALLIISSAQFYSNTLFALSKYCENSDPEILTDEFFIQINNSVIQPNCYARPVSNIWPVQYNNLSEAGEDLKKIIEKVISGEKNFSTGDHCKFCPALLSCPAIKNYMELLLKAPSEDVSSTFLEEIFVNKKIIENYLTQVEAVLKDKIEKGERLNRVQLVTAYGHRRWIDPKMVIKKLKYLGEKMYEPRKLLSPAQMEKVAGKKNIENLYSTPEFMKVAEKKSDLGAI